MFQPNEADTICSSMLQISMVAWRDYILFCPRQDRRYQISGKGLVQQVRLYIYCRIYILRWFDILSWISSDSADTGCNSTELDLLAPLSPRKKEVEFRCTVQYDLIALGYFFDIVDLFSDSDLNKPMGTPKIFWLRFNSTFPSLILSRGWWLLLLIR